LGQILSIHLYYTRVVKYDWNLLFSICFKSSFRNFTIYFFQFDLNTDRLICEYIWVLIFTSVKRSQSIICIVFPIVLIFLIEFFFWKAFFFLQGIVHQVLGIESVCLVSIVQTLYIAIVPKELNRKYTSSDPKKSRNSLWKLITFDSKNQLQQNKQIKLKLSYHDNTQFVWV